MPITQPGAVAQTGLRAKLSSMRNRHMGPLGMIRSMIDTSRGRTLVYHWRYLTIAAIITVAVAWWLIVHLR
jgi:hypothetical protein